MSVKNPDTNETVDTQTPPAEANSEPDSSEEPKKRGGGPKSESGKRRSSLNARRHLLTSKVMIAPPEEMAAYDAHCKAWREAFAPVGIQENELVQEICDDKFRLKRVRSIEHSIFALGHDKFAATFDSGRPQVDAALAEGMTWIQDAKNLQLLTLYESRIRRAVEKNIAELTRLQKARKEAYREAQCEAIKLVKAAVTDGVDYDPGDDFLPAREHGEFVFSAGELARVIDRRERVSRAFRLPDLQLRAA